MHAIRKKWRNDEGSVDLMQLFVGLLIISIAAVGTLQGLVWGYGQLETQMRHRKALSIARSYVEYLQGRLHCDFDVTKRADQMLAAGNTTLPLRRLLDERDPATDYDNIYCDLWHTELVSVDLPETKGTDYWKIRVFVEWEEPTDLAREPTHKVWFEARMTPVGS